MTQKDLEETIKEKVTPLLEKSMQHNLGITIPQMEQDITDKLTNPLHFYIPFNASFKEAKKTFRREFLKQELRHHSGNISALAKVLDVDRRSIHRAIKEFKLNPQELRGEDYNLYYQGQVGKKMKTTLDQYKEIIIPAKLEKMYEDLPRLSRNITKFLPLPQLTWKKAEHEFEKQFFSHALKEHDWNVAQAAKDISVAPETLHRKIKKLHIHKTPI